MRVSRIDQALVNYDTNKYLSSNFTFRGTRKFSKDSMFDQQDMVILREFRANLKNVDNDRDLTEAELSELNNIIDRSYTKPGHLPYEILKSLKNELIATLRPNIALNHVASTISPGSIRKSSLQNSRNYLFNRNVLLNLVPYFSTREINSLRLTCRTSHTALSEFYPNFPDDFSSPKLMLARLNRLSPKEIMRVATFYFRRAHDYYEKLSALENEPRDRFKSKEQQSDESDELAKSTISPYLKQLAKASESSIEGLICFSLMTPVISALVNAQGESDRHLQADMRRMILPYLGMSLNEKPRAYYKSRLEEAIQFLENNQYSSHLIRSMQFIYEVLFNGVKNINQQLLGREDCFINLGGVYLSNIDLSGLNFSNVNFSFGELESVGFQGSDFSNSSSLQSVGCGGSDFTNCNFSAAYMRGIHMGRHKVRLINVDLSNADLTGANLADADLSNANLSRTNLSFVNLSGALVVGVNMNSANLLGIKLRSPSHFDRVTIYKTTDISVVDLTDVTFFSGIDLNAGRIKKILGDALGKYKFNLTTMQKAMALDLCKATQDISSEAAIDILTLAKSHSFFSSHQNTVVSAIDSFFTGSNGNLINTKAQQILNDEIQKRLGSNNEPLNKQQLQCS